jgi:hypothetical protein
VGFVSLRVHEIPSAAVLFGSNLREHDLSMSLRHTPGSRTFVRVLSYIVRLCGRLPISNGSMSSNSSLNVTARLNARQAHFIVPSASSQLIQASWGLYLRLRLRSHFEVSVGQVTKFSASSLPSSFFSLSSAIFFVYIPWRVFTNFCLFFA